MAPVEDQLGSDRFCIEPHVGGLPGGTIYKRLPQGDTHSYLMLEAVEPGPSAITLRVGKHLLKEYRPAVPRDPQARFGGTLVLRQACCVMDDGLIEPSGESRVL